MYKWKIRYVSERCPYVNIQVTESKPSGKLVTEIKKSGELVTENETIYAESKTRRLL